MKKFIPLIFLLAIHLIILINLQFTAWPEMFSYPYLFSKGLDLYQDIALPYQPFLILSLTLIYSIFGNNLLTLQIFTWFIILASDLLIFLISKKIIGDKLSTYIPLGFYVLLQPLTYGNMLWFDLATVPFLLMALICFFYKKWFGVGLFLGVAFFIKQQTGLSVALIAVFFFLNKKFSELKGLILGFGIISLLILIYVLLRGTFEDYFFWTVGVPLYWYPKLPGYSTWPTQLELAVTALIYIPSAIYALKNWKNRDMNVVFILLIGLFLVAFIRFDYFRFQPALAVSIILLALNIKKRNLLIASLSMILAIIILYQQNSGNIHSPTRFYGSEETILSKRIEELSQPEERIYLLGVPSIVYVLSNRLPPRPWVDNYVWYMEIGDLQEKVIEGFEKYQPKFIFWKTPIFGNWYDLGTYQPKKIVDYIRQNYEKTETSGEIEIWTLRHAQGKQ